MTQQVTKELQKSKVAAVVVTYNRKNLLRECLRALLRQTRPLDEIIVIDNASTDGTDQMVPEEFPQVTYVRLPENIGGAGGFHEGMELAYEKGHDWIWVMDDDAIPASDALKQLLKPELLQNNAVYALASAVLNPDGSICTFHRRLFNPMTLKEQPVHLRYYEEAFFETDTTSFVGTLISRRAIAEIGLPLKEFFIYYDDTEYSLRIRNHGGKILVVPESKIMHKTGGETQHVRARKAPLSWRTFYGRRNMLYTHRKYGHPSVGFYMRLFVSAVKSQVGIILFRRHKLNSTKILWLSMIDGFRGKLGKSIEP